MLIGLWYRNIPWSTAFCLNISYIKITFLIKCNGHYITYHVPKNAFMNTPFLTVMPKYGAVVNFFPQLALSCFPGKLLECACCKMPDWYNFQVVMLACLNMNLLCSVNKHILIVSISLPNNPLKEPDRKVFIPIVNGCIYTTFDTGGPIFWSHS